MKFSLILASAVAVASANSPPSYKAPPPPSYKAPANPPGCAYDSCLWRDKIPAKWKPAASAFCKALGGTPAKQTTTTTLTTTTTATVGPKTTITQAVTPASATATQTQTETGTDTVLISCSTTVTTEAITDFTYPRFTPVPQDRKREAAPNRFESNLRRYGNYPDFVNAGCKKKPSIDKVKAACKCFLGPQKPSVVTATATSTVTVTLAPSTTVTTLPEQTITATSTETTTTTIESCTSTATSFELAGPISSCGAPPGTYASRTTGQITCTQPANAPSGSVNAFHRIEADNNQGTVYEGCIYSGPRSITTPSGGTHQCGASTGTSITGQTDAAAMLTGFTYDGSFSPSFNDYFITRIGATQQSGNSYWGVLNNGVFTTSGGCGAQVRPGDSSLWQWDAFNLQSLLTITPQWEIVAPGDAVTITVTSRSPNGGGSSNFGGATLSGGTDAGSSDSNGQIRFTAPSQPGCYVYKASANRSGRSNAYYLNVVEGFPATIA